MKIDVSCVDSNTVGLVKEAVNQYYETKQKLGKDDKDTLLKMYGLVCGILAMADAMKEVLKA